MSLQQQTAIVTGGASGIGEATVRRLVADGANVIITDINDEQGEALAKELAGQQSQVQYLHVDVANEEDVQKMIHTAVQQFGSLDILFANAGIGDTKPAHELGYDEWKQLMDVNLNGVFLTNKYAIQQMLEQSNGGKIINNASMLGHVGTDSVTSYTAAKGGVVNLTRTLGVTYAKQNIRINSVCPGYVETPLMRANMDDEALEQMASMHPVGRLAQPSEVASVVSFLAGDDASFIHGSNLLVDGGYTAQ